MFRKSQIVGAIRTNLAQSLSLSLSCSASHKTPLTRLPHSSQLSCQVCNTSPLSDEEMLSRCRERAQSSLKASKLDKDTRERLTTAANLLSNLERRELFTHLSLTFAVEGHFTA